MGKEQALVILTPGFPENESDTTCLPMQQRLIRAFGRVSPHLKIIILSFQYPYHRTPYSWFGNKVIPFNGKNRGGLYRLLRQRKITRTLNHLQNKFEIIGLLSFWYGECAAIGNICSRRSGIPHYCWISGQDVRSSNKYPRKSPMKSAELVAISDFTATEFEKNHSVKPARIIPPGIETRDIQTPSSHRTIDILGVGSLIQLKQYDLFIKTAAAIHRKLPTLRSALIGKGPERSKLENMIKQYGLQDATRLYGELPHYEVLSFMRNSKILLHPSSAEGYPGVCMEALYAGTHIVSFCKPMNNVIEHWHTVSSKVEMEQKVFELLTNPNLSHQSVVCRNIDQTARQFLDLF